MTVLVTGAAGFIGMHTAERLLARGERVLGVDDLNGYYSPALKEARLARLRGHAGFEFEKLDLADRRATATFWERTRPDAVIHLAAQAGVRYSLDHPWAYLDANLAGFLSVLEGCRAHGVRHLVYASSSSVYGANSKLPFSVTDPAEHPVSLYAATKRANELMAQTYAHLFRVPTTGLRFFTVYGPWGRPDMAYYKFTEAILAGRPISVFNQGRLLRDFTFVDDVVEGVVRVLDRPPAPEQGVAQLHNIGNSSPVELLTFIETLERVLGVKAQKRFEPMQPGDVPATYADVSSLTAAVGFRPHTPLEEGLRAFVTWYRSYHGVA